MPSGRREGGRGRGPYVSNQQNFDMRCWLSRWFRGIKFLCPVDAAWWRTSVLKEKGHATNYQCTRSAKQKAFLFSAGGTPSVVHSATSLQEGKSIKMLFASGVITCAILLPLSKQHRQEQIFFIFFFFSLPRFHLLLLWEARDLFYCCERRVIS